MPKICEAAAKRSPVATRRLGSKACRYQAGRSIARLLLDVREQCGLGQFKGARKGLLSELCEQGIVRVGRRMRLATGRSGCIVFIMTLAHRFASVQVLSDYCLGSSGSL